MKRPKVGEIIVGLYAGHELGDANLVSDESRVYLVEWVTDTEDGEWQAGTRIVHPLGTHGHNGLRGKDSGRWSEASRRSGNCWFIGPHDLDGEYNYARHASIGEVLHWSGVEIEGERRTVYIPDSKVVTAS